jgi:hypothetical protein
MPPQKFRNISNSFRRIGGTTNSKTELLYYSPTDQNWWLGAFNGTNLGWTLAGTGGLAPVKTSIHPCGHGQLTSIPRVTPTQRSVATGPRESPRSLALRSR